MKNPFYVAVTCDSEFLPPWNEESWEKMSTWSFEQGLPIFSDILDRHGIKGTFFVQAKAAEKFPEIIRQLADKEHLVGSHGYNHENYGSKPVEVWTKSNPVFLKTKEKKRELLMKANAIIKAVTGYRPSTFVAPFDNIDEELIFIIDELGFEVDCSFHNYSLNLNSFPFYPKEGCKLIEIPLTVLAMGSHGNKNALEAFTYNFAAAKDRLKEYIEKSELNNPFTVVLLTCHPYEFLDIRTPHPREFLIMGKEKITTLNRLIPMFKEMGANFLNPLEIARKFIASNVQSN